MEVLITFSAISVESWFICHTRLPEVEKVLRIIGKPLIVECNLDAKRLKTFSDIPWEMVWLSAYHFENNPSANRRDVDAYVEESIPIEQVMKITDIPAPIQ